MRRRTRVELLLRRAAAAEHSRVHSASSPSRHGQETDTECTVRLTAKAGVSVWSGRAMVRSTLSITHVRNAPPAYPAVERFELIDYKVRILDQGHGTDATVRVLIETTDGLSAWTTVGVGQNIIEARGRPSATPTSMASSMPTTPWCRSPATCRRSLWASEVSRLRRGSAGAPRGQHR